MPISQSRILEVLEETSALQRWAQQLRSDLLGTLDAPISLEARQEALRALLEISPVPACVRCSIEQDHFRRVRRRNEKSRLRMQRKRHSVASSNDSAASSKERELNPNGGQE